MRSLITETSAIANRGWFEASAGSFLPDTRFCSMARLPREICQSLAAWPRIAMSLHFSMEGYSVTSGARPRFPTAFLRPSRSFESVRSARRGRTNIDRRLAIWDAAGCLSQAPAEASGRTAVFKRVDLNSQLSPLRRIANDSAGRWERRYG